jgi:hypothetical protein
MRRTALFSVEVAMWLFAAPRASVASRREPVHQIRYSRAEQIRGFFYLSARST